MTKQYPKVPHYYHDSVPDAFFASDDLVLIEKVDGSNTRLLLYDDRYADLYSDEILNCDPDDGDVFIGSKRVIRGTVSDSLDQFDGNFDRLVTTLRDRLDVAALRELHTTYDSPLLLYGEHMVRHTLDYGYGENPPPAFIGFDVLPIRVAEPSPANPFEERFNGFLSLSDAFDVFTRIGVETAPIVDRVTETVDPDTLQIPISQYENVEAEGVVMRSDSRDRRVKYVTEMFQERAQEAWGVRESNADSGAELFSARYLTNGRIRKTVNKLLHDRGADGITASVVGEAVVADAWEEELADITDITIGLTPRDVYPLAETRSQAVIDTMQTNAALNDVSLDELWSEYYTADEFDIPSVFDVSPSELTYVTEKLRGSDDVHTALVKHFISDTQIHDTVDAVVAADDRDAGRWVITAVHDELVDVFWYGELGVIANLPVEIVPSDCESALMNYISATVETRDDVVIDEKPDDWQPSIDDADTTGLGNLF